MANLITTEYLRSLDRMRLMRTIVVMTLLLSLAALIGIIALLPSYLIARQERATIEEQVRMVKTAIDDRSDQVGSTVLRDAREQMQLAQAISDRGTRMTEALTLTRAAPQGINVVGMTYDRRDGNGVIVVSGTTSSREALAAYAETLRGSTIFAGVTVPLATIPRAGGDFSITLTGDF